MNNNIPPLSLDGLPFMSGDITYDGLRPGVFEKGMAGNKLRIKIAKKELTHCHPSGVVGKAIQEMQREKKLKRLKAKRS